MQLQLHYTNYITHHSYNSTTLQLQLQLRYTTLHAAVVGEVTDQVTTNHCNHSKKTIPTTFQSISGFALPSLIHNSQEPSSPIGFLFWIFRHRLYWYYW